MGYSKRMRNLLVFGVLALAIVGCDTTHQARGVKPTGFLANYSQLQEGAEGQALLVYVNPRTHFAIYDKVIIDPIAIWFVRNPDLIKVPPTELRNVAGYLHKAMTDQLKGDYQIVKKPGPGVMRLRLAIVEAKGSRVALDTLSNILPPMVLITATTRLAGGTHLFVGKAGIEAELVDSVTGARLAAAIDRRAGRKVFRGKFGTWNDVKEAHDYWAERLRKRLADLRAK
jgi:hypothetical protein